MTRAETRRMQQHLNRQGLGPLTVDGVYGPATERAYQRYLQFYTPVDDAPTPPAAKPWWTSRALWGALATILISIAGIFIDVSNIDAKELADVLVSMSTGFAGLLALYGTITRKAPIDPTLAAPGVRFGGTKRLHSEAVQTHIDAAKNSNITSGFPDGPFFDS
jgi:hypothetical protein